MNYKRTLTLLITLPLLAGCGSSDPVTKPELVIPTVDVEHLTINLPDKPKYNEGAIRSDGENDYIDLYEISDFHGAVNYEAHSSGDYIGLANLAGYLNKKRESNQGGTVVVSSGDMFQGSADSNLTRGYMVNYAMNYMGFDSMALGNHEFDWTDEWIKKNANLDYKGTKIPYLCANLVEKSTEKLPDFVKKSTIVERGDYKVGIIGSIGEDLKKSILASCVSAYEFKEEKSIVEAEAQSLRDQGCNVVVWTTHNGVDAIPIVNGVDAIFGGHAHENKKGSKGSVPAVATINYGRSVAHIELKINKQTKAVTATGNIDESPLSLEGLTPNADIKNIMGQYDSSLNKIKNIKLATTENDLAIEGTLKNICVDGMQAAARKANVDLSLGIEDAQICAAYHNVNGGIRSSIAKGDILYNDIYRSFPFDNEIVLIKVSGEVYKGKAPSKGLADLAIWKNFSKRTDIKTDKDYYIVTTDFLALSEAYFKAPGLFPELTEANLIRTGVIVRECLAQKIYKEDKINSDNYATSLDKFKPVTLY